MEKIGKKMMAIYGPIFATGSIFATVIFLITHGYVFNDRQIYFFEHGYLNHNRQKILIILAKPYFLRVWCPLKFSLNFLVF